MVNFIHLWQNIKFILIKSNQKLQRAYCCLTLVANSEIHVTIPKYNNYKHSNQI